MHIHFDVGYLLLQNAAHSVLKYPSKIAEGYVIAPSTNKVTTLEGVAGHTYLSTRSRSSRGPLP